MSTDAKVVEVASAAVVRDGRVLLVKRARGKSHGGRWVTPGGKLEPGESHRGAAARELREECGMDVGSLETGMSLFVHELPSTSAPGRVCRVACLLVRWVLRMGEVRLRLDEVDGFAWFEPEEVRAMYHAGWLGIADSANAHHLMAACRGIELPPGPPWVGGRPPVEGGS